MSDQPPTDAELRRELEQQVWRARSNDPATRADAHGRMDEIDEILEERGAEQ